jgi:hypothetical protein
VRLILSAISTISAILVSIKVGVFGILGGMLKKDANPGKE